MDIRVDDLSSNAVIELLEEHLADMYATSPPESVHALDIESLKAPDITFFTGWSGDELQGCVAIKQLTPDHVELKSVRTASSARTAGVATALLTHALEVATDRGYRKASLETGVEDYFKAARALFKKFGFRECGPFADYTEDPNSCYMTRDLV